MTKILKKVLPKLQNEGLVATIRAMLLYFSHTKYRGIGKFKFPEGLDIKKDIQEKYSFNGDLLDIFVENQNNALQKWHHYIPLYDQYFRRFRSTKVRFLEIGVSSGGSLQMWRKYFGEDAIIFGIDIDPNCAKYNGLVAQVRIGSQGDPAFLQSVVQEMGGIDIVLDDGSHVMELTSLSLRVLFPHLSHSGVYMIEDLHTAYWREFGGGVRNEHNFFNRVRDIIDDMHHWYHGAGAKKSLTGDSCSAIHIHDSIVVLEKNKIYRPTHSQVL
jgi:hypothetical protein